MWHHYQNKMLKKLPKLIKNSELHGEGTLTMELKLQLVKLKRIIELQTETERKKHARDKVRIG